MAKLRTKYRETALFDAFRNTDAGRHELPDWVEEASKCGGLLLANDVDGVSLLNASDGMKRIMDGDWIVKTRDGSLAIHPHEVFIDKYEEFIHATT